MKCLELNQSFKFIFNIALIITDGQSNIDSYRLLQDVRNAQQAGITILVLGITDAVDR